MTKTLTCLLFACLMFALPLLVEQMTQGFRLSKLQLDWPRDPKWDTPIPDSLPNLLNQPFTFLGKGVQSFAFIGADGRTVVKLLRFDRKKRKAKYLLLFQACKTAYDQLQKETGLIYIHLNPTTHNLPIFHCKDPMGRTFHIPLDTVRFIVQKKVEDFETVLLRERNDPIAMQKRLEQFFHLIHTRASKGVWNKDPSLTRNFGFLENEAIEFDFGNYRIDPNLDPNTEIRRYQKKMDHWLEKLY